MPSCEPSTVSQEVREVKIKYFVPTDREGGYSLTYLSDSTLSPSAADEDGYFNVDLSSGQATINVHEPDLPLVEEMVQWAKGPRGQARFVPNGLCAHGGSIHFLVEKASNDSLRTQQLLARFYREHCSGLPPVNFPPLEPGYIPLGPIVEYRTAGNKRFWRDRQ